jgi:3-deoxy-D-manno-octulosonic-acid transferase
MFNFAEATRLALEAGAAVQEPDAASAVKRALALLHDSRERRHMSEAGRKLCQRHRGATERHLALIAAAISAPTAARG